MASATQAPEPSTIARFNIEGLSARIRFNPEEGRIWLQGQRMVLLHLSALASLRRELIDRLGSDAADTVLFRVGYASGTGDAAVASEAKPLMDIKEAFMAGPLLHSIEGMAGVETVRVDVDEQTGDLSGEWLWLNSAEVEAHLDFHGMSAKPVCWTLVGYASAFTSAFLGRPIIFREVECKAMGAPHCRVVARPAEQWDDKGVTDMHLDIELATLAEEADGGWKITDDDKPSGEDRPERLVGISPAFVSLMQQIKLVAPTDCSVLLIGEPGVGKKSCARLLHQESARSRKQLIFFNCAAQRGQQLDTDLFGVEKSSSGAGRQGKIERAHGGTIYLEDVHHLDHLAQTKLLAVLQNASVERMGATHARPVDVRIVASANGDLTEALRTGRFRGDLYYRLAVIPVIVPSLRERRNDIPYLIRHFYERFGRKYKRGQKRFSMDAASFLLTHDFHGNVSELESMLERGMILSRERDIIGISDLASPTETELSCFLSLSKNGIPERRPAHDSGDHGEALLDELLERDFDFERFERDLIGRAVDRSNGNLSRAAKLIGITRAQLSYRYKKLFETD
ncbi:sigma-54-dependent Fis family transcriptional regulator [Sphingopyxis sp. DBS4]|uniref:sigma-54-dependent Fis family transcriptional regulator n=1 Tax=Sphingopyxis sp. DBS4 TaxID=2968500 RepID=UPI00214C73B6|nr:sigma-54-dependent Fis family transcriptional regulator [Sphingopyxis sp. DBS4]